jgi:acyl-CoA reductase-like NAD-dependent aldehyde dehydrogenase
VPHGPSSKACRAAAGCTAILKPAEQTPLSALELAALAEEAGVPPGALSVLTGDGATGAALVRHPAVDKVSFTGSRDVGVEVMRSAAATLKRVTLELGGKSPNIVFADAPFEQAMAGTAAGIFGNQGEICSAGSRVLVERSIYDEALQALVDAGAGLRLGHGLDPATTMGPLVTREQQERVQRYVAVGEEEGAKVALRGDPPTDGGLERGFFVAPTIFYDVGDDMRIAQEEIFGPVMAVIPYAGEEELVRLANGTEYGLAAAIWTRDVTRALRTARAVRAGTVWINDAQISPPESLWGGFKQSGLGRELGPYGLEAYLESKQIYINLATESAGQRAS